MHKTTKSPDTTGRLLIGYARVSTEDQDLRAQEAALLKAGVLPNNLYTDKKSGSTMCRPGLEAALLDCRPGDVLIVPALDRLSRSVEDLIYLSNRLSAEGVQLRSLRESIDTTTPFGTLFFHLMAALAQFERSLIGQRTRDGMAAAKARGVQLGRKPQLTGKKYERAVALLRKGIPAEQVARRIGMSGPRLRQRVLEVEGRPLWQTKPRKR
jgi:DNA invertase Pin-like site-specific DNA recombinase